MKLHIKNSLNRNLQCLNSTVKGHVKAAEIDLQKNLFMHMVAEFTKDPEILFLKCQCLWDQYLRQILTGRSSSTKCRYPMSLLLLYEINL